MLAKRLLAYQQALVWSYAHCESTCCDDACVVMVQEHKTSNNASSQADLLLAHKWADVRWCWYADTPIMPFDESRTQKVTQWIESGLLTCCWHIRRQLYSCRRPELAACVAGSAERWGKVLRICSQHCIAIITTRMIAHYSTCTRWNHALLAAIHCKITHLPLQFMCWSLLRIARQYSHVLLITMYCKTIQLPLQPCVAQWYVLQDHATAQLHAIAVMRCSLLYTAAATTHNCHCSCIAVMRCSLLYIAKRKSALQSCAAHCNVVQDRMIAIAMPCVARPKLHCSRVLLIAAYCKRKAYQK